MLIFLKEGQTEGNTKYLPIMLASLTLSETCLIREPSTASQENCSLGHRTVEM